MSSLHCPAIEHESLLCGVQVQTVHAAGVSKVWGFLGVYVSMHRVTWGVYNII